jgi:hypothetical protein
MIGTTQPDSSRSEAHLWVVIINKFPEFSPEALPHDLLSKWNDLNAQSSSNNFAGFLVKFIPKTNPWFAGLILGNLNGNDLEKVCEVVQHKVFVAKGRKLMSVDGLRGQLCLTQPWYLKTMREHDQLDNYTSQFIVSHFAHLSHPKNQNGLHFSLEFSGGELYYKGEIWRAQVHFTEPSEDPLFFLIMSFTGWLRKFELDFAWQGWEKVFKQSINHGIIMKNPNAPTDDGTRLEGTTTTALIIASQIDKFKGTTFLKFLNSFVHHLSGKEAEIKSTDLIPEKFCNIKIPYLVTVNHKWPNDMNERFEEKGYYFGNIARPKNDAEVDVTISECSGNLVLRAECKYRDALELKQFKGILTKWWKANDCKLQLVITKNLTDHFSNETHFENWVKTLDEPEKPTPQDTGDQQAQQKPQYKEQLSSTLWLRVVCKDSELELEKFPSWRPTPEKIEMILVQVPLDQVRNHI